MNSSISVNERKTSPICQAICHNLVPKPGEWFPLWTQSKEGQNDDDKRMALIFCDMLKKVGYISEEGYDLIQNIPEELESSRLFNFNVCVEQNAAENIQQDILCLFKNEKAMHYLVFGIANYFFSWKATYEYKVFGKKKYNDNANANDDDYNARLKEHNEIMIAFGKVFGVQDNTDGTRINLRIKQLIPMDDDFSRYFVKADFFVTKKLSTYKSTKDQYESEIAFEWNISNPEQHKQHRREVDIDKKLGKLKHNTMLTTLPPKETTDSSWQLKYHNIFSEIYKDLQIIQYVSNKPGNDKLIEQVEQLIPKFNQIISKGDNKGEFILDDNFFKNLAGKEEISIKDTMNRLVPRQTNDSHNMSNNNQQLTGVTVETIQLSQPPQDETLQDGINLQKEE